MLFDIAMSRLFVALGLLLATAAAVRIESRDFLVDIDDSTGAIVQVSDPQGNSNMNWVSSTDNAPWQPLSSRWGLGFADLGSRSLHRSHWKSPRVSSQEDVHVAKYVLGDLELEVSRSLDKKAGSFLERYSFTNTGKSTLNLRSAGTTSLGIYTPFNDHYTNASDALASRAHAHIWANGGATAWVKMNQMGGNGRNLGLVVTQGALAGYSVEGRDTITSSNTRGVFLLHPAIPALKPGETSTVSWTLFWHGDWEDFFQKCSTHSSQFIRFQAPTFTLLEGESLEINMTGAVDSATLASGKRLECGDSLCRLNYTSDRVGEEAITVNTKDGKNTLSSTIYLNTAPSLDELISKRIDFIIDKQQVLDSDDSVRGAYLVYDNQAQVVNTWDNDPDRNAGRERVGMGVLMARYLRKHPDDAKVRTSLEAYYNFVSLKLQDERGNVLNGPGDTARRLYNWPWVMELHINMARLDLNLTGPVADKTPLERYMLTLESFYQAGGSNFYPIGLPILDGLHLLKDLGNDKDFDRALSLFVGHGNTIVQRGINYPSSEVNFEQSIVAPAAIITAELYRATGNRTFLDAARLQLKTLERFAGQQPDHRMHEVSIRHWDGYWFGKDRHWGDTFPHYWSTLNAVAFHHISKAVGDKELETRKDAVLRANLALFSADGSAGCAWIYPLSVNGRKTHYRDPYANDQDWALVHFLQIEQDSWKED